MRVRSGFANSERRRILGERGQSPRSKRGPPWGYHRLAVDTLLRVHPKADNLITVLEGRDNETVTSWDQQEFLQKLDKFSCKRRGFPL